LKVEKLVGVKEVAEMLGIPTHAVYRLVSSKKIPYIKFRDRGIRFSPSDLKEWIDANKFRPNGGKIDVYFKSNSGEGGINNSGDEKVWSGCEEDQGERVSSLQGEASCNTAGEV
jgi:excisionase family DNA binding protein